MQTLPTPRRRSRSLLLLGFVALALLQVGSAAEQTIELFFLTPGKKVPAVAIAAKDSRPIAIPRTDHGWSKAVSFPAGEALVFVRRDADTPAEPIARFEADSLEARNHFLILPSSTSGTVKIARLGSDLPDYGEGDYLLANESTAKIIARFHEQRAQVAPGKAVTITPQLVEGQGFHVEIVDISDAIPKTILTTGWTHRSNRSVLVLVHEGDDGAVRTSVITDRTATD